MANEKALLKELNRNIKKMNNETRFFNVVITCLTAVLALYALPGLPTANDIIGQVKFLGTLAILVLMIIFIFLHISNYWHSRKASKGKKWFFSDEEG